MSDLIKTIGLEADLHWDVESRSSEWAEVFGRMILRECEQFIAAKFDPSEPWIEPGDLSKHFGITA
jgi:hypothetical protein